jgi:hypothetical protein
MIATHLREWARLMQQPVASVVPTGFAALGLILEMLAPKPRLLSGIP